MMTSARVCPVLLFPAAGRIVVVADEAPSTCAGGSLGRAEPPAV
jgi:hypothetical protein